MSTDGDRQTQRDIGSLSTEVKHLNNELSKVRDDVKAIRTTLDQANGGFKMLLGASTLAGAIAGSVATVFSKKFGL